MKVIQIASGSKGNITLVKTSKLNILIDAGITLKKAKERIKEFPNIDILIITHVHDDHVKGINSYLKEYHPKLYTKVKDAKERFNYDKVFSENFIDDDVSIKFFPLSHDSPCSGVLIKDINKEMVYITDTGYINNKILENICNKELYIMESNHDIEKLRNGKYPFFLQQRILGDKGHLSNEDASKYLSKLIGIKTKNVILAHLSEENNDPYLAKKALKDRLKKENINFDNIYIASQDVSLEEIEV